MVGVPSPESFRGYFVDQSMAVKSVTSQTLADMVAQKQEPKAAVPEVKPEGIEAKAPEVPEKPEKEAPKSSVQARIDELTREKKELDEFAQSEYEARLQAQRRISELEARTPPTPEAPKAKPRPDRTKYEDATKYEDDLLAWSQEEALRRFREEQAKADTERQQREINAALMSHKEAAKAQFADFDEVIESADRTQVIPEAIKPMLSAIAVESEYGVKVLYHLAKNPDEAKRIFQMKPAAALMALGRIEQQFISPAKPDTTTQPPVSKAPPPIASLNAGGSGTVLKDLSEPMAYKDYKRQRMAQRKGAH